VFFFFLFTRAYGYFPSELVPESSKAKAGSGHRSKTETRGLTPNLFPPQPELR